MPSLNEVSALGRKVLERTATRDDIQRLREIRNERREQSQEGYCKHGHYVGGCGVDWMCGSCEGGFCEHGRHTNTFQWETPERCEECEIVERIEELGIRV